MRRSSSSRRTAPARSACGTTCPQRWIAAGTGRSVTGRGNARRVVRLPGRRLRQQAGARQRPRHLHRLARTRHHRRHRPSAASTSTASTGAAAPSPAASPSPKGEVYPLWCGVQVPIDAKPGRYTGSSRCTRLRPTADSRLTPTHDSRLTTHVRACPSPSRCSRHHRRARRQRALAPLPPPLAQLDALPG